jgi:hypothetical protein
MLRIAIELTPGRALMRIPARVNCTAQTAALIIIAASTKWKITDDNQLFDCSGLDDFLRAVSATHVGLRSLALEVEP